MDGTAGHRGGSWLSRAGFFGILALAVTFRFYALGRLPGVNGDEAWYGVLAEGLGRVNPHGWLTPSGNPPAPLQLGALAALCRLVPPSFALLRVPAVLASLAQLLLTFVIARRHFGRGVATVAVLLTAALPIEIAYARFGWDPSHSGLVAVAALHFALIRRLPAATALLALAVWVHPTNIFLAPFLIACVVHAEPDWRPVARRMTVVGLVAGVALFAALGLKSAVSPAGGPASAILWRVIDPRQWLRFVLAFVRLLDGDTIFTYITGAGYGAARGPIDLVAAALIGGVVVRGGRRLAAEPRKRGVVFGWLACVAAFFVFAGPDALQPGLERYGMCLMVPTILALSILVVEAGAGTRPLVATALVSVALLLAFWRGYFVALETTGSTSHETFWTGPVEPKAEAMRRIESDSRGTGARVIADGYWLFWPLAYLAHGTKLEVGDAEHLEDQPPPAGTFLVGFPAGRVEAWARRSGAALLRWEIPGAAGRIVLRVWQIPGR
jgi:hypothetical protein